MIRELYNRKTLSLLKDLKIKSNIEIFEELNIDWNNLTDEEITEVLINYINKIGEDTVQFNYGNEPVFIIDDPELLKQHSEQQLSKEEQFDLSIYKLKDNKYISDEVFEKLPEPLKTLSNHFEGRSRDIVLLSSLAILSGCYPTVSGVYDNKEVFPNLFAFIIAPAASDKSVMGHAKYLASAIEDYVADIPKVEDLSTGSIKSVKKKRLFLPCDSSAAALIKTLAFTNGVGIMCETEADTMGNSLKQDWGSYSDLLRKSFHHEPVHQSRKKDDEYNEIKEPKLSILLTGTPGQVAGIIKNVEDGLSSRFIYYVFSQKIQWRDAFKDKKKTILNKVFKEQSDYFLEIHKSFSDKPYEFELTAEQQSKHKIFFSRKLKDITKLEGNHAASSVMRLGLILFRIAMILTIVRSKGTRPKETLVCSDEDYRIAEFILETALAHNVTMLQLLKSKGGHFESKNTEASLLFLFERGKVYQRSEILASWESAGNKKISVRTLDSNLKILTDRKLLVSKSHGKYELV